MRIREQEANLSSSSELALIAVKPACSFLYVDLRVIRSEFDISRLTSGLPGKSVIIVLTCLIFSSAALCAASSVASDWEAFAQRNSSDMMLIKIFK